MIAFRHEPAPEYEVAQTVSPLVRRIVARNPSPFTYHGTATYVIGRGEVALVDPGPDMIAHVDALLRALRGERVTHQLITHTHRDHSPAARLVKARLGARTYGFGPHGEGRYERGTVVEAGADHAFVPDVAVHHGEIIEGSGWTIECVHTPGHCSNHLCFSLREERALFSGDHVMGWATAVISPPDGDMRAYLASLERVLERDERVFMPTHGPPIFEPQPHVRELIEHRRSRERQILTCLARGIRRIEAMVPHIYKDTPALLYPAAARSVFAHMLQLHELGAIACEGEPTVKSEYRLA